eukprot:TRINITY_DN109108_c0_g1_i1.p1 TRINITY_DN109108_c0_g1~~TRINITY_DN109108_c0_g1_i1.p1  ORF type:complete len:536 (-),score=90.56 TRINITY_DN109108_c0_g1_i1:7-1545(-)
MGPAVPGQRRSSAPATPNLGPVGSRPRVGSVSGGPWQLVEVNNNTAAAVVRSNQGSPAIPLLRASADEDDGWMLDKPEPTALETGGDATAAERRPSQRRRPNWAEQEDVPGEWPDREGKENGRQDQNNDDWETDGFDPNFFLGEWRDNLGHSITVEPAAQRGNRRWRDREGKGDRGGNRLAFTAFLQKLGVADKRFTIALDRSSPPKWRCGNGTLVVEDSGVESLSWLAEDGRVSKWERPIPEGPVYFDAPPNYWDNMQGYDGGMAWGYDPAWEWKGDEGAGGYDLSFNPEAPEFVPSVPTPSPSPALGPRPMPATASRHRASPTLTPAPSPAIRPSWGRTPTPSPMLGPAAAPQANLQQFPPLGQAAVSPASQAEQIQLETAEESPDVVISGARLEWCLPDSWAKLSRFPKDFCITSPMFGVKNTAANMQLAFYPNGSRVAEPGHCTVALTRGPESAGIKFEFMVNGRGIGSKVCLGRRYLGDYPMPFDDSEENKPKKVTVCMQVLEILGK